MRTIRRTFLAGLLVVVPMSVTVWVLWLLVTTLDRVGDIVPDRFHPEVLLGYPLPGIGILLAFTAILLVGVLTENFVGRRLVDVYEGLLARVPVVSSVYATVKQVLQQLTQTDRGFERVVLVQWPREGAWAVGFVTGSAFVDVEGTDRMVNIFLPTTPNPTSGFYFMVAERDVVATDMSIEEAAKLIMSAGIVEPGRLALPTGEEAR
jgi:uncharacterized membrane protein